MSFIWSRDIPSKRSRVFTSTRYWIWETNALTDFVVCLIAYFRRTSRGCSLSQQISASNCLVTETLSPFLTIMSPRETKLGGREPGFELDKESALKDLQLLSIRRFKTLKRRKSA